MGQNLLLLDQAVSGHILQALKTSNGRISGPKRGSPTAWNQSQHPQKPNEKVGYFL